MSNHQFRTLCFLAAGYFGGQVVVWVALGFYLWMTGTL
jgi:hypothetical protein